MRLGAFFLILVSLFIRPSFAGSTATCFDNLKKILQVSSQYFPFKPSTYLPLDYRIEPTLEPEKLFRGNSQARMVLFDSGSNSAKTPFASVRIEIEPGSLAHENFVAALYREVGGLNVPRSRNLTPNEVREFTRKLKQQNPKAHQLLIEQLAIKRNLPIGKGPTQPDRIVISEWIPETTSGTIVLGPLQNSLRNLNPADPTHRATARTLINPVISGQSAILDKAFVMASITGGIDFHSGNWLKSSDDKIWFIDFSLSDIADTFWIDDEAGVFFEAPMHPYLFQTADTQLSGQELATMSAEALSTEEIQKLTTLTATRIKALANAHDFNISDKKIDRILERVQLIYDKALGPRPEIYK